MKINWELVLPEESQTRELAKQRNDRDVSRYTGNPQYPYTIENAREDIQKFREEEGRTRITRTILVDGAPAGMVYFHLPWRGQKSAELGYWLGKKYWGLGITTAASRQMCTFAFDTLDINRICASALKVNVGSWRVLEKLGMRREGEFLQSICIDGVFFDDLYYAILREEFTGEESFR